MIPAARTGEFTFIMKGVATVIRLSGRGMFLLIGLSVIFFIFIIGGVLVAPLLNKYGPHARPSSSIADAKAKGRYYKAVKLSPKSMHLNGCEIELKEAWIETANRRKLLFFGFTYHEPV